MGWLRLVVLDFALFGVVVARVGRAFVRVVVYWSVSVYFGLVGEVDFVSVVFVLGVDVVDVVGVDVVVGGSVFVGLFGCF